MFSNRKIFFEKRIKVKSICVYNEVGEGKFGGQARATFGAVPFGNGLLTNLIFWLLDPGGKYVL